MTERLNHKRVFFNFCVRANGRGYNDSLVYLFGCYVFYCGGGNGDSLRGKEFCGKKYVDNLFLMSCKEEMASESQNE